MSHPPDLVTEVAVLRAELAGFREVVAARVAGEVKALGIQAVEYERRFHEANETKAGMAAFQTTYLRTDLYDSRHTELIARMDADGAAVSRLVDRVSALERANANLLGRMYAVGSVVAVASALIGATLSHLFVK